MRRITAPEALVANGLFQGKSLTWWLHEDMPLFTPRFSAFFAVFSAFIA
jgi:hypothetical protein